MASVAVAAVVLLRGRLLPRSRGAVPMDPPWQPGVVVSASVAAGVGAPRVLLLVGNSRVTRQEEVAVARVLVWLLISLKVVMEKGTWSKGGTRTVGTQQCVISLLYLINARIPRTYTLCIQCMHITGDGIGSA